MIAFIGGIVLGLIFICSVFLWSELSVYGKVIKESELDLLIPAFLDKNVKLIGDDDNIYANFQLTSLTFIARRRTTGCVLGKWYVQDYGIIPWWSKWHPVLEGKRIDMINEKKS